MKQQGVLIGMEKLRKPGPYDLVKFFEGVLEEKTGVRPNLAGRAEGKRQMGAAKRLLAECEGDYQLAQEVIRLWAEDPKSVREYPSLSNVIYHQAQLIYRVKVVRKDKEPVTRGRFKRKGVNL